MVEHPVSLVFVISDTTRSRLIFYIFTSSKLRLIFYIFTSSKRNLHGPPTEDQISMTWIFEADSYGNLIQKKTAFDVGIMPSFPHYLYTTVKLQDFELWV